MRCHRYANGLCGDCAYCEALLVTRPISSITEEEWELIRKRFRLVNGLRPAIRLVTAALLALILALTGCEEPITAGERRYAACANACNGHVSSISESECRCAPAKPYSECLCATPESCFCNAPARDGGAR